VAEAAHGAEEAFDGQIGGLREVLDHTLEQHAREHGLNVVLLDEFVIALGAGEEAVVRELLAS